MTGGAGGGLLLGVDGGGTKTAYAVVDAGGAVRGAFEGGTTNYNQVGFAGVEAALRHGVGEALARAGAEPGALAGAVVGIGGVGEIDAEMPPLLAAVAAALGPVPHRLTNDCEVGWAGGLALEPGINVVAGTGSIAFGRDGAGRGARVGGWAWRIGDEGSAHWLGRQIVQTFTKQSDGRLPRTALYGCVKRKLGITRDIEIRALAETIPRRDMADLAQVLPEAMALGDSTPAALYGAAGAELALHVRGLRAALCFGPVVDVTCSGGVFSSQPHVLEAFRDGLAAFAARHRPARTSPVLGAALLAAERFRPDGLAGFKAALLEKNPAG